MVGHKKEVRYFTLSRPREKDDLFENSRRSTKARGGDKRGRGVSKGFVPPTTGRLLLRDVFYNWASPL